MKEIRISEKESGQRLDKFLVKLLPLAPMSFFFKNMRKKNIVLNKKKVEGKEILQAGDCITLFFSEETLQGFTQNPLDVQKKSNEYQKAYSELKGIKILYENKHILALYKPTNMLSQKAKPQDMSINEWAIGYLIHAGRITDSDLTIFKPSVVNRLDRNTSGVILVGKTLLGSQSLSAAIKDHSIQKFYRAICLGNIKENEGHLVGYLLKNEKTNKVMISQKPPGDKIETKYKVLSRFKEGGKDYSYLEIQLLTGKSHQIRAHFSSIGHPIAGDGKYGKKNDAVNAQKKLNTDGQMLHAFRVEFPEDMVKKLGIADQIIAPLPQKFYMNDHII